MVVNEYGVSIDFKVAEMMMDAEVMEELHSKLAPCTEQDFFDEYARRHQEKFFEVWELAKPNPCY